MPDPLLCVTVTGKTMEELRRARDAASSSADLVEVRLDGVADPQASGALEGRRRPVIVTCRPEWEGGGFKGSEEERRRILVDALVAGAEFVDVEARASFLPEIARMRRGNRGLVVSWHSFGEMPEDLGERAAAMRGHGAEVVKIAVMARQLSDNLRLFDLARELERDKPDPSVGHALIAMGEPGVPSRVLAARLRNRWTYAGDGVAPGQLPASRMLNELRFRRIKHDAALYGVAGSAIGHSLSPAMHNAGFAAAGLNAAYLPLQTDEVDDFVRFARGVGLRGASITAPHKVAMLGRVDEVDPVAARVGAINTVTIRDGRWIGANTDVAGFLAPLAGRIALKGTRATVLGAGGAARAVAVALAHQGAAVTVCARRPAEAEAVARLARGKAAPLPPKPGSWDVLINATSVGSTAIPGNPMHGQRLDGEIVFDLIYAPADTELLIQARRDGCMTIGGIEMLVAQAERQFELWTGQRPPAGLFLSAATHASPAQGEGLRT